MFIEYLLVAYDRYATYEVVITRCVPEEEYLQTIQVIQNELLFLDFKLMFLTTKESSVLKEGYNKSSIIPTTRSRVVIEFAYNEEGERRSLTRVAEIPIKELVISQTLDELGEKFVSFAEKEWWGEERLKQMLKLHWEA